MSRDLVLSYMSQMKANIKITLQQPMSQFSNSAELIDNNLRAI